MKVFVCDICLGSPEPKLVKSTHTNRLIGQKARIDLCERHKDAVKQGWPDAASGPILVNIFRKIQLRASCGENVIRGGSDKRRPSEIAMERAAIQEPWPAGLE